MCQHKLPYGVIVGVEVAHPNQGPQGVMGHVIPELAEAFIHKGTREHLDAAKVANDRMVLGDVGF